MADSQIELPPETEHAFHNYRTHAIPFYVRLLWIGFYSLAIYYTLFYMFPAIQSEFRKRTPAEAPAVKSAAPAKQASATPKTDPPGK